MTSGKKNKREKEENENQDVNGSRTILRGFFTLGNNALSHPYICMLLLFFRPSCTSLFICFFQFENGMREIGSGKDRDTTSIHHGTFVFYVVYKHFCRCWCMLLTVLMNKVIICCFVYLQYYEMSYGLNVEMHKQVNIYNLNLYCKNQITVSTSFQHVSRFRITNA